MQKLKQIIKGLLVFTAILFFYCGALTFCHRMNRPLIVYESTVNPEDMEIMERSK